jgi:dTDP-glucose pyrophosphorylase
MNSGATLQQTIQNLNESALQIVLIVDSNERLIGTVTDGDIRRGLLTGLSITASVDAVINRSPFIVSPTIERNSVLELMQFNKIHQSPIIDEHGRVVGLHIIDDLMASTTRQNIMVIMAGGVGSRLRPHTDNCPKPMLPVLGKPMLEHIIIRAKKQGIQHFVISTHYLGHMIEDYFGDGNNLGVRVDYLREKTPLGTAGAINLLNPRPTVPFLVTNGDVLTDVNYGELLDFHSKNKAEATMAVRAHEWQHPFGVVETKGINIIGFIEKPISITHINAGIYVLQPSVLEKLSTNSYCDMPTLFFRLKEDGERTIVYPLYEPWQDIGMPDEYEKANGIGKKN